MWIITMNITFAKMLLFFQERPAKSNDTWCTPQDVIPFPQTHICHPTHQDDEATKMDWMQCGTNISILFISVQFSRITTEEAAFLGFWNLIPPNQLKIILLYTTYQSIIIHPSIYLSCVSFFKGKIFPNKKDVKSSQFGSTTIYPSIPIITWKASAKLLTATSIKRST